MNVTLHAFWVGCLHSGVWFMMPNSYFTKDTKCSKTHPSAKACVCMVWYVDRLISAFSFKTFRSGDGSTSFLQFSFLNILTAMDRHLLMCLRIPPNQYECCLIAEYFWVGNISTVTFLDMKALVAGDHFVALWTPSCIYTCTTAFYF